MWRVVGTVARLPCMRPLKHCLHIHVLVNEGLKINFRRRRRVVGRRGFKKMRVATLSMIFSITYYLELQKATIVYCASHFLPTKVELVAEQH